MRCLRTQFISAMFAPDLSSALVDRLLVGEGEPFARHRQQRRSAAGDQAEHQVVVGETAGHRQDAPRHLLAGGIRHRVGGLDHLDALARQTVAVARDDQAGQRTRPMILHRLRHRGRGLAGADHDGAALGRRPADGAPGSSTDRPRRWPPRTSAARCPDRRSRISPALPGTLGAAARRSSRRSDRFGRKGVLDRGRSRNLGTRPGHEDAAQDGSAAADLDRGQGLAQRDPGEQAAATGLVSRLTEEKAAGRWPRAQEIMLCPMVWLTIARPTSTSQACSVRGTKLSSVSKRRAAATRPCRRRSRTSPAPGRRWCARPSRRADSRHSRSRRGSPA